MNPNVVYPNNTKSVPRLAATAKQLNIYPYTYGPLVILNILSVTTGSILVIDPSHMNDRQIVMAYVNALLTLQWTQISIDIWMQRMMA